MNEQKTVSPTPETVRFGYFDSDADPIETVESDDTLVVETISIFRDDHVQKIVDGGIPREDVLGDEVTISNEVPYEGPGPHTVIGPIYIEDATPGDILEVQIRDIDFRAPYGRNTLYPGEGVLPDRFSEPDTGIIPLDSDRQVASFPNDIEVPLDPFFGIIAVIPSPDAGRINTKPPSHYGGNMDNKELTAGTSLYFPVHVDGALLYVGDGHAAQGDGEVNVNGIETSLIGEFTFAVHEGEYQCTNPLAETDDHYVTMGLHEDLDRALEIAVEETITFLETQKGLTADEAYRLASCAIDFDVSQGVNDTKGIHGLVPKAIFPDTGRIEF